MYQGISVGGKISNWKKKTYSLQSGGVSLESNNDLEGIPKKEGIQSLWTPEWEKFLSKEGRTVLPYETKGLLVASLEGTKLSKEEGSPVSKKSNSKSGRRGCSGRSPFEGKRKGFEDAGKGGGKSRRLGGKKLLIDRFEGPGSEMPKEAMPYPEKKALEKKTRHRPQNSLPQREGP